MTSFPAQPRRCYVSRYCITQEKQKSARTALDRVRHVLAQASKGTMPRPRNESVTEHALNMAQKAESLSIATQQVLLAHLPVSFSDNASVY